MTWQADGGYFLHAAGDPQTAIGQNVTWEALPSDAPPFGTDGRTVTITASCTIVRADGQVHECSRQELLIDVVKVDLDVDSNNDGSVADDDDVVEMSNHGMHLSQRGEYKHLILREALPALDSTRDSYVTLHWDPSAVQVSRSALWPDPLVVPGETISVSSLPITLFVRGLSPGETEISLEHASGASDRVKITVFHVSLTWETLEGGHLEDNTHPQYPGGKRIFPGSATPTGPVNDRVRVVAALTPPIAGVPLFLKSFDVDDPSDDPIIDPNDDFGRVPTGGDNFDDDRGLPNAGVLTPDVPPHGHTSAVLQVTIQPGNNFRVLASFDATFSFVPNSAYDGFLVGEMNPAISPVTETLTTWRRLHIEADGMRKPYSGQLVPDQRTVLVTSLVGVTASTTVLRVGPFTLERDLYEEGHCSLLGPNGYLKRIVSNDGDTITLLGALTPGQIAASMGRLVTLRDDDDHSIAIGAQYNYAVPQLMIEAFSPAYIAPVKLADSFNPRRTIPFHLYYTPLQQAYGGQHNAIVDVPSTKKFWCVSLMFMYQAASTGYFGSTIHDRDVDPDDHRLNPPHGIPLWAAGETGTFGWTLGIDWENIGVIFCEAIRDDIRVSDIRGDPANDKARISRALIEAHEIGHTGGGLHSHQGIMQANPGMHSVHFTPPSIRRFREDEKW